MTIQDIITDITTGVSATTLLLSKIRELFKESSVLLQPFKELLERLTLSSLCNEDKKQLLVLQEKLASLEENQKLLEIYYKELSLLISQTETAAQWMATETKRESLAKHAADRITSKYSLSSSDKEDLHKKIVVYLYLIHHALLNGRTRVIEGYFEVHPNTQLRLDTSCYREALELILEEKVATELSSEVTKIARAYFDYLVQKLS